MAQSARSNFLLVAAMDFKTTYLGYAFSFREDFKKDQLKIHANQAWNAEGRQLLSLKTLTCLLDSDKNVIAFGYEAKNKYAELVSEEQHGDHFYFHRFKMILYKRKAGIPSNKLLLALEPEAASIYCQYLPIQKLLGADPELVVAAVGTKYMVVDLGGGTADITVLEKIKDGRLKETCCASGGICGGKSVDVEFFNMMEKIMNQDAINAFKRENLEEYLDLAREFETRKEQSYLIK